MWRIVCINNTTHELTLTHTNGNNINLIIPEEHRTDSLSKNNYIKSQTVEYDKQIIPTLMPEIISEILKIESEVKLIKTNKKNIWIFIIVTVLIASVLYMRFK